MLDIKSIFSFAADKLKIYIVKYKFFLIIFISAALFFKFYPNSDLIISSYFYDPVFKFAHNNYNPAVQSIYNIVNYITAALIIIYLIIILADIFLRKNLFGIKKKTILFLLLTLALGPGIIVNAILKENIGRPRPEAIIEFGGDKEFVAPFTISNACKSNCSFTSGHAALGFYLMAFGFIAKTTMRKKLIAFGFLFGIAVSLARIAQGRHFFTDTLFSFFFVYFIITLTYEMMFSKEEI